MSVATAERDTPDSAIAALTPTVTAPRYADFEPVQLGYWRFVHAANGMFIEARSPALYARLQISPSLGAPYGSIESAVHMRGGVVGTDIADTIAERALYWSDKEWAGVIVYDHAEQCYRLIEPKVRSHSDIHISYERVDRDPRFTTVVDVHPHGHGRARFSAIDDASDTDGFYIAVVLGGCQSRASLHWSARITVFGRFVPIQWLPWEEWSCSNS